MSIFEFAAGFDDGLSQAERATLLSSAIRQRPGDDDSSSAILGVGLMVSPIREMLSTLNVVLAVDVNQFPDIEPTQTKFLGEVEGLYKIVVDRFADEPKWLHDVRVFGLFEAELHLASADRVQATLGGSTGCSLSWSGGHGFAMAGHVAPIVGLAVKKNSTLVGQVVWANNPTGKGNSIEADFAVVEIGGASSFHCGYTTYARGRPYDQVKVVQPSGVPFPGATILGMFVSFALPSHNSTLGEVYMTSGQFTSAGDSGAPIINRNDELIGHVIGASPGISTLIQDLSFQIGMASKALTNLGI